MDRTARYCSVLNPYKNGRLSNLATVFQGLNLYTGKWKISVTFKTERISCFFSFHRNEIDFHLNWEVDWKMAEAKHVHSAGSAIDGNQLYPLCRPLAVLMRLGGMFFVSTARFSLWSVCIVHLGWSKFELQVHPQSISQLEAGHGTGNNELKFPTIQIRIPFFAKEIQIDDKKVFDMANRRRNQQSLVCFRLFRTLRFWREITVLFRLRFETATFHGERSRTDYRSYQQRRLDNPTSHHPAPVRPRLFLVIWCRYVQVLH